MFLFQPGTSKGTSWGFYMHVLFQPTFYGFSWGRTFSAPRLPGGDMLSIQPSACTRSRLLAKRMVDNEFLFEARTGEREGRDEKDVGRRVESAWSCWKGSEKNHMRTTMWFFGMAFRFPILFYLGGSGGNTRQTSLRMMKKRRRSYVFKIGTVRPTARFYVIPGFWPRWALSWPESCIAVPATLDFGLGCLQRRRGARKTQKSA